jgi:hypothetical protein
MILKFPNLETLQLALTTGVIPANVLGARAVAGFGDDDELWVEPSVALPRGAQTALRNLGGQVCKTSAASFSTEVSSWLELLPLQPDPNALDDLSQTPVLFELAGGEELSRLVIEIMRLGNDRQKFHWLEAGKGEETGRALLHVIGPPYYSLLRALDHRGEEQAPRAFVEQAPGVWVELGFKHPLAAKIKPPKGKLLLLRPPRQWTLVPDAPFHDVYEVLEFQVPEAPARWKDAELDGTIRVPLSLRTGGSSDGAELWLLREDAVNVLNYFVQHADDKIIEQLRFAVGQKGQEKVVVLRVRKQQQPPPVLVLPALGYKPHLKLPNLFLPAGHILHPPLRRDVVRKLLAEDIDRLVWLQPGADGSFTPESLPENSFRPLKEWIDYVLDQDHEALEAWMQASRFDFEQFLCDEEPASKPKKPPGQEKPKGGGKQPRSGGPAELPDTPFEEAEEAEEVEEADVPLDDFSAVEKVQPSELQKRLNALQEQFLALEGGLDTPERQAMWPELAWLHGQLNGFDDAGLCWLNALWEQGTPSPAWVARWLASEGLGLTQRHQASHRGPQPWIAAAGTPGSRLDVTRQDLDRLLRREEPSSGDMRALTAYIVWAARRTPHPEPLVQRLAEVQRFLEKHERLLPVRAVWLGWSHLAQLAHGDALGLARARDRLLERLYHNGLRPEQDLPSFLRFAGQASSQRFRAVRDWMVELAELAQTWVKENTDTSSTAVTQKPPMDAYVNLLFAFGLARLGENDAGKALLDRATTTLSGRDDAHSFLLRAYDYRIRRVLDGQPGGGPLPAALLEELEHMQTMQHYIVDRLRKHSHILEPEQRIDPYRHWSAQISELDQQLSQLTDVIDRQEIVQRLHRLLREVPRGAAGNDSRLRIVLAGLEAAPRVNEELAREMLDLALPAYDAQPALESLPEERRLAALEMHAKFLERALFVAAHFDRIEHIHPLVARFEKLLQTQRGPQALKAIDLLAGQCFRGLRKLGMRNEIDHLLEQMADLVLHGRSLESVEPEGLRALLHVASGWYYFGRDSQADPILQRVREVLLKGDLPHRDQNPLACAYARAVGQATVSVAQKRLEEIFQHLRGVKDTFTTSSHFSVSQLDLVESVVLAVVSDDFTMGTQGRRWLDDDEFLVRRRIHRDWRALDSHS